MAWLDCDGLITGDQAITSRARCRLHHAMREICMVLRAVLYNTMYIMRWYCVEHCLYMGAMAAIGPGPAPSRLVAATAQPGRGRQPERRALGPGQARAPAAGEALRPGVQTPSRTVAVTVSVTVLIMINRYRDRDAGVPPAAARLTCRRPPRLRPGGRRPLPPPAGGGPAARADSESVLPATMTSRLLCHGACQCADTESEPPQSDTST
jgi:hypothetical protein